MTTKATYLELLSRLSDLDFADEHKSKFESLIREAAADHGIHDFGSYDRVQYARHLLTIERDRTIIRDRICTRFTVSRSQAYTDIEAALNQR